MLDTTETVTTPLGHRITFFKGDYIGERIRKHGLYEYTTLRFLVSLLARMDKPVVLDIGANIGNHTLAFSRHASAVYAFEPIAEIFRLLTDNIAQGGTKPWTSWGWRKSSSSSWTWKATNSM